MVSTSRPPAIDPVVIQAGRDCTTLGDQHLHPGSVADPDAVVNPGSQRR